jgi:transposase-like protein
MPTKKKPLSLAKKKVLASEKKRRLMFARREKGLELYKEGWTYSRIAKELGVNPATIQRWVRDAKLPPRNAPRTYGPKLPPQEAGATVLPTALEDLDEDYAAKLAERQTLAEVAENQASPADQYQAYVAGHAIKLLRDSFANVRGPRTVRELSELDQLIRRSMGLNPKGNAGGGLTIDISILNSTKPTKDAGRVIVEVPTEGVDDV